MTSKERTRRQAGFTHPLIRQQAGFTLIEALIVVVLVAILATLALASYKSYIAKAATTEAVSMIAGLKTGMIEFYEAQGNWPTTAVNAGIPAAGMRGKYVSAVAVTSDGVLTATFGANPPVPVELRGKVVAFGLGQRGTNDADASPNFLMTCGLQELSGAAGFVHGTGDNALLTTVPGDLLPSSCKGASAAT